MSELAGALVGIGQQVMQQQQGQEQPTVCFAAVPLLIPAAVIVARVMLKRLSTRVA